MASRASARWSTAWAEDLEWAATLAAVEVARDFAGEAGDFESHVRQAVRFALLERRRELARRSRLERDAFSRYVRRPAAEGGIGAELEARDELESRLANLPPKLGEVLRIRALDGRTQEATALALGISQSQVSRREKRAVRALDRLTKGSASFIVASAMPA